MEKIGSKYVFSEPEITKIINWYLEPKSLKWIALQFSIKNKNTIKNILIANGIALHDEQTIKALAVQEIKQTCLEKYGVENPYQVEAFKEKAKQTKLSRYGDENYRNQEQIELTCLKKYNTTNGGWSPIAQEKIKQTNKLHWGQEYYFGCHDYFEKTRATCQQKYGTDWPAQVTGFQERIEQTMLKKYGARRYAQTIEFHVKSQHKYKVGEVQFDSLPELAYYLYCLDHNIVIKRSPTKIKYTHNNIEHVYIPDFEVAGELVEIKGDHFFDKDNNFQCPFNHNFDDLFKAKYQCMLENNVKILRSADYKFALDYFVENYNKADFEIT